MMKLLVASALVATVCLNAASAQTPQAPAVTRGQPGTQVQAPYKEIIIYSFPDNDSDYMGIPPSGELVTGIRKLSQNTLLTPPLHFLRQLLESAEAL